MPVKFSLKGLEALNKELPAFAERVERETAKRAPAEIVRNIELGATGIFPFARLPENKASTKRAKIARGNGDRPLQDELYLTDDTDWNVTKNVKGYLVKPPENRAAIVGYLSEPTSNRPAYKIMEMPDDYFPKFAREILLNEFSKFMKKHG
jgi:hypothetical protein